MAKSSTSFKKGQSGNPKGRPRSFPEFVQRMRDISGPAEEKLVEAASEGEGWAITLVLHYAWGKPPEAAKDAARALSEVPEDAFWLEAQRRHKSATASGAAPGPQ